MLLLLRMMVLVPVVSFGQDSAQRPRMAVPPIQNPFPPEDEEARVDREMAKKANQERQVQLKRDTNNLLKLATELKLYVDKSSENTLSVDVIRKADEIERLAHNVKEKMKGN